MPIDAILVGGRRPSTIPLVYQSLNWEHGVFSGAVMGSEITAAVISDKIGQVRRDPFAMLPFIGYHVGDYLGHWLEIGRKGDPDKLPKIFAVNWFRRGEDGHFLWPGFGENSRVLKWVVERCDGVVGARNGDRIYARGRRSLPRRPESTGGGPRRAHQREPRQWQQNSRPSAPTSRGTAPKCRRNCSNNSALWKETLDCP